MKKVITIISLVLIQSVTYAQWHVTKLEKVNIYRQLNGEVEAVNKATVSAQTTGRVTKLNYDVDDFVAKGSIVVEITNTEQKAQLEQVSANAQAAKIAYEQAQTDYVRIKDIYAKKLIAKSELDRSLSNRNALKAKSSAAQAAVISSQKQLEYTIIRAPYDGIVIHRYVELGETVNPGTAIMEGLSLDQLRVVTNIPEKIINKVKSNPQAIIINDGNEIQTQAITIFPYADKLTRTFKARLELETSQTQQFSPLFPGMTVKVAFKVAETQRLLIPATALIIRSELTMVYIKHGNSKILRHVKTGVIHGKNIEIIAGLNINEQVFIHPLSEK
ncbi:MAG: efflux RND transporter periplasmic adaptor subunit [Alcanivoracaceae bacterium]|nr:efflux RND transporter periplasmic adaptor subunit [Alcanivoracaceae bacterium]